MPVFQFILQRLNTPLARIVWLLLFTAVVKLYANQDYSAEPFVVEAMHTNFEFKADGSGIREQSVRVKLQSDAGIRAWGMLSIPFSSNREHVVFDYVRVIKRDGTKVETPVTDVPELSSPIAQAAPTFSDFKEKRIVIRGLETGSELEYQYRVVQTSPEVPGHFWLARDLFRLGIVLDETISLRVPADKYVLVSSPSLAPVISESKNVKTYLWKTAYLEKTVSKKEDDSGEDASHPAIQLTTFRTWNEVGEWYRTLASPRAVVTPEIRVKAEALTKGLTTDEAKKRALYDYVSGQFRYVSLSFGVGHYQPHSADEVLANQYGDCKDKHTLLAALLKAVGIESWPVLIGSEIKLDPAVPSPGQFNHLITILPKGEALDWVDATQEVAPYRVLVPSLRGKQALVIPSQQAPYLATTPENTIYPRSDRFEVDSTLAADGTLTGHFDITMRGDAELIVRSAFRNVAANDYQKLVQAMSAAMGFGGEVKNVTVENLQNVEKPLHYGYDYERKGYSDWENHRITPPLPVMDFASNENGTKPKTPIDLGIPGEVFYRAIIHLPAAFNVTVPDNKTSQSTAADYNSTYSLKGGVFTATRHLKVKNGKLPVDKWADWTTFQKAIWEDHNQWVSLTDGKPVTAVTKTPDDPEVMSLLQQAAESVRVGNLNAARELLMRAKRKNSDHRGVWYFAGWFAAIEHRPEEAITDFRKEIQLHPDNESVLLALAEMQTQLDRQDEAIETLKGFLKNAPQSRMPVLMLAKALAASGRAGEAVEPLRTALATSPNDSELRGALVDALLHSGNRTEGIAMAKEILGSSSADLLAKNDAAYGLAEAGVDIDFAKEAAKKVVNDLEAKMTTADITSSTSDDMQNAYKLATVWDTYGWTCFKAGDLPSAEHFVSAAWQLSQEAESADHLGQIYQRQGKIAAARHSWELALAANNKMKGVEEKLRNLGVSKQGQQGRREPAPSEELGRMRTVAVPNYLANEGSAEFFILLSPSGTLEAKFISGREGMRTASDKLKSIMAFPNWPDQGPERILRRGILACSNYTKPNCQFTFLLPKTAHR